MGCFTPATAILGAGALGAGASIFGGANAAQASTQAAQIQADTARQVAAMQQQNFNRGFDFLTGQIATGQGNLAPFASRGLSAYETLQNLTGTGPGGNPLTAPLTAPFTPTMASLAATPGYQFTLQQGEQAVQNQFASQGLGASGAALKGAANYAEGLAGTTYQQQFQNYLNQNQQIYNMLGGSAAPGLAATQTSANLGIGAGTNALNSGIQSGQIVGNTVTGGAAAAAGGVVGSANALNAGLGGVTGAASNTGLLLALNNAGLFGGGPTANMSPFVSGLLNAPPTA